MARNARTRSIFPVSGGFALERAAVANATPEADDTGR
jgi:hypothetical protein